jgi:protein-disulfide isomerase
MSTFMRWNGRVLACCAIVTATAAAYESAKAPAHGNAIRTVANWRSYATEGHRIGPAEAAVTVIAFSDYECPFTRELAQQLRALAVKFPTQFRVIYRDFPLGIHDHAMEAATAAECADRQGRFRAFHELITTIPTTAFSGSWNALATKSGILDTIAFARCRTSPDVRAKVNADKAVGEILGVTATPGILVNDEQYSGLPKDIEQVIVRALKRTGNPLHATISF